MGGNGYSHPTPPPPAIVESQTKAMIHLNRTTCVLFFQKVLIPFISCTKGDLQTPPTDMDVKTFLSIILIALPSWQSCWIGIHVIMLLSSLKCLVT